MESKTQKKTARKQQIRFSETIKKGVVRDIENGKCTVLQASREIQVRPISIYRWLERYSRHLVKNRIMVIEDKSESYRTKELERRLKDAEAALGRKQMEIDFLNKLIEFANEEFKTDIKKNLSNAPSLGSKPTKGKDTPTT